MVAPIRYGAEGLITFYGSSFISDPYGRILVQAPRDESAVRSPIRTWSSARTGCRCSRSSPRAGPTLTASSPRRHHRTPFGRQCKCRRSPRLGRAPEQERSPLVTWMAPIDATFLAGETREHPMHVGGLLLFQQPSGADHDFVGDLYRHLLTYDRVRPSFRRRPANPGPLVATRWHEDDEVDLEYHVRLSALPRPGRIRELLTLVSRLHGTLLDRHRPLWEFHLIEGLADGRFAMYFKVHHALVDGINATRQMHEMFSEDPSAPILPPLWSERHPAEPQQPPSTAPDTPSRSGLPKLTGLVTAVPSIARTDRRSRRRRTGIGAAA